MSITIKRVKINLSTRKLRKKHEAKVIKALELSRADARYFVAYVRYQHTSKRKPMEGRFLDMLSPLAGKLLDKKLKESMLKKYIDNTRHFEWDETEFVNPPVPKPTH